jgi:hypothetical protein
MLPGLEEAPEELKKDMTRGMKDTQGEETRTPVTTDVKRNN